jgi:hypothetical protein
MYCDIVDSLYFLKIIAVVMDTNYLQLFYVDALTSQKENCLRFFGFSPHDTPAMFYPMW